MTFSQWFVRKLFKFSSNIIYLSLWFVKNCNSPLTFIPFSTWFFRKILFRFPSSIMFFFCLMFPSYIDMIAPMIFQEKFCWSSPLKLIYFSLWFVKKVFLFSSKHALISLSPKFFGKSQVPLIHNICVPMIWQENSFWSSHLTLI